MPVFRLVIPALPVLFAAALASCAQFPELDDHFSEASRQADYPQLVPVESLRADLPEARIAEDGADRLEARIAGLRTRAARLRGRVIDAPSRARLSQPVTLPE